MNIHQCQIEELESLAAHTSFSRSSISAADRFQGDLRLQGSRSQLMMSPCGKDLNTIMSSAGTVQLP